MIRLKRAIAVRGRLLHSTPLIYLVFVSGIMLCFVSCFILFQRPFCVLLVPLDRVGVRVGVLPSVIVREVRRRIEKHERKYNQTNILLVLRLCTIGCYYGQ